MFIFGRLVRILPTAMPYLKALPTPQPFLPLGGFQYSIATISKPSRNVQFLTPEVGRSET